MKNQSKKSYAGNKSEISGCLNEGYEIFNDLKSSLKSKNSKDSSNIKIPEKRERSKESLKISEKAYKEKKISESQKEFIEVNEMSET